MANLMTLPESSVLTYTFVYVQMNPSPQNFTAASNTQTTFMFGMPANYAVCAVQINPTEAIVGSGLSSLTVEIGVSGTPAYYAAAFNIMQSSSMQLTSPLLQYSALAHDINATFISTGAFINAVTAGQIQVVVQIRSLP